MNWKKNPVFKFFSSLKLAVISILLLASVLTYGTIAESFYGMRGAHFLVYGTWWFMGVLVMLGLNVLCAALSRFPWKRHQTGFVVTHAGILTLLFGSFLTQRFGLDGNLPVVEGSDNNEVILNELRLSFYDDELKVLEVPVPESARSREGKLLTVDLGDGDKVELVKFVPRVVAEKRTLASPIPGAGVPAVSLALFNSRFRVEEWLLANQPDTPTELNLGPAILTFRKLWSVGDEQTFFRPPASSTPKAGKMGRVMLEYSGRAYSVSIDEHFKKWKVIPGSSLELIVDRYLPYAVVEKNELVSKSNEPKNPACQIRVRMGDKEEKHTIFALFPEFTTLHRSHGTGAESQMGLKLRMFEAGQQEELMGVGRNRGRLELAQSHDNSRLLYRSLDPNGKVNSQGTVKLGQPVDTGWMDLRFEVNVWHPSAIQEQVPREVDQIQGGDSNFLSAVQLEPGGWLLEGEGQVLSLKNKKVTVRFGKSKEILPFPIFLKKFTIGNDPGTTKAATYESEVGVEDVGHGLQKTHLISMNEPLEYRGYTFYQASYQLQEGRPPVSVFSVNWDPGRWVKYLGSLMMVIGASLMFYMNPHYWDILFGRKRKTA